MDDVRASKGEVRRDCCSNGLPGWAAPIADAKPETGDGAAGVLVVSSARFAAEFEKAARMLWKADGASARAAKGEDANRRRVAIRLIVCVLSWRLNSPYTVVGLVLRAREILPSRDMPWAVVILDGGPSKAGEK